MGSWVKSHEYSGDGVSMAEPEYLEHNEELLRLRSVVAFAPSKQTIT